MPAVQRAGVAVWPRPLGVQGVLLLVAGDTAMSARTPAPAGPLVEVYRLDGSTGWVTPQEAATGMIAFGRQRYGPGTPGFAACVQLAVELLAGHGLTPGGQRIGGMS
jgi:hypothetical protein